MTKMRFADEIVVDHQKNEIRIDGVAFPYWVEPDPVVEVPRDDQPNFGVVRVGIIAHSITYVSKTGDSSRLVEATPAQHSEWAKRRAKEVVLERMADVLSWLEQAAEDREDAEARAHQRGVAVGAARAAVPPVSSEEVERQRRHAWELYRDHPMNQPVDIPQRACDNAGMKHDGHLFTLAGEGQFSCPGAK